MSQTIEVTFHGATLLVVEHSNQPYVPMKPVVTGMGMAWESQAAKLRSNPRWGVTEIVIPSAGGQQRMNCLPLRKLPGWLATISPNKVRPELREKVIAFQNEADDVLWQAWQKQPAPVPPATPALDYRRISPAGKQTIRQAVAAKAGRDGAAYQRIYETLHRVFQVNSYHELPEGSLRQALAVIAECQGPAAPPASAAPTLRGRRWVVDIGSDGKERVIALPTEAITCTWERLVEHIHSGVSGFTNAQLIHMTAACAQQLSQRTA